MLWIPNIGLLFIIVDSHGDADGWGKVNRFEQSEFQNMLEDFIMILHLEEVVTWLCLFLILCSS